MKKIAETTVNVSNRVLTVKIYDNRREWNEYVVRLFCNGTENKDASHHTDDRDDAFSTSLSMLKFASL
tara:strand:+ start:554 stop:757 length:204 start_codon:yes stop_codon:yes gene_type:complete